MLKCAPAGHWFSPARSSLFVALLGALIVTLAVPLRASAHPLGNFTVNRYSRIEVTSAGLQLLHIIDMAEIPAHQERSAMDLDHNGEISEQESKQYLATLTDAMATQLQLTLDGKATPWTLTKETMSFPTGQAGLPTLRIVTDWQVTNIEDALPWQAAYHDTTFADRLGWQEVVVHSDEAMALADSTAPTADVTAELTTYPADLLQSPLAVNQATFNFTLPAGASNEQRSSTTKSTIVQELALVAAPLRRNMTTDHFAELINVTTLSPWAILLALLAAFGWGAAHAFSPGHGKTVVAAYLVGSRGTVAHALFLGTTTTVTHTAGVFALGLLTLFASHYILPETLYPWLSLLSGLLVVAIGLSMVRERWLRPAHGHHHRHVLEHEHGHEHDHHPDFFVHHHYRQDHQHDHQHEHEHDHQHGDHHGHDHHHGAHTHSHLPPGGDGTPVTWRSLLALGISGGLLPCPSALVLMLGAISLNRIGFGLALIVLFSLGLASVLTAVGVTLVYAGKYFERIPESGRLFRLLPVASALFITAIGLGITIQALLSTGTLRLI